MIILKMEIPSRLHQSCLMLGGGQGENIKTDAWKPRPKVTEKLLGNWEISEDK
jgi:hypothetical protein